MRRAVFRGGMAALLLTMGLASPAAAQAIEVAVSVLPQKHFVERIGGDRVAVTAMVQPGQSPHTYEPTPRQVAEITAANVYFRMGVGFESAWMPRLRDMSPGMHVVDLRDGIALRAIEGHEHAAGEGHMQETEAGHGRDAAHGDGHGQARAPDPHVWTDPRNVITMAATIRDTLSELDPAGAEGYRERFAAYRDALLELDAEIEAMLADVTHRRFMVYHPSWGYFADRYGLEQLPIELEGKEPGPATLAQVIDAAREAGVRVIFVQPQFSARSARRVAAAIGGEVLAVDPLAEDYADNLRRVARAFRDAMQ